MSADLDLDSEGRGDVPAALRVAGPCRYSCTRGTWPNSPRLDRWMAQWLTAMPAETHLSILALILGGVFDKIDDRLKIGFAHGWWIFRVLVGPDGKRLARPQRHHRYVAVPAFALPGKVLRGFRRLRRACACDCWWTRWGWTV